MLEDLLRERKPSILTAWRSHLFDTYPPYAVTYLKRTGDRFRNPMGAVFEESTAALYDMLLGGMEEEERLQRVLDGIVRIRAVQDFSPAEAVGFIFLLKKVVREEVAGEVEREGRFAELLAFESRVDRLALHAFDLFMNCREEIYQLREGELRRAGEQILRRAQAPSWAVEEGCTWKQGDRCMNNGTRAGNGNGGGGA
ncbi:MAG TPA: hypothetical protein ENI92_05685 [Bacteroidetes bacterium]|nr:hypothetical protein [Bacteroidota bacterium]